MYYPSNIGILTHPHSVVDPHHSRPPCVSQVPASRDSRSSIAIPMVESLDCKYPKRSKSGGSFSLRHSNQSRKKGREYYRSLYRYTRDSSVETFQHFPSRRFIVDHKLSLLSHENLGPMQSQVIKIMRMMICQWLLMAFVLGTLLSESFRHRHINFGWLSYHLDPLDPLG